ncbi:protein ADM2a [Poecilia reticulata]|uniref:Adrenomedullin 2a n=1 Tax=Poecilia reticulata TaxID=8081 RepID=A0A3P9PUF9_POERE|nr:PREDICTED: ADM2-like [Poecilia reticulata]XP_008399749.1 PREDICTED: ADM2-like [Poecilia reticulata]XP_008399750.1 PREDICTED: ADM2-like [Poecilia reticulata]
MRSFLPLVVCCISLLSLQQLSASPAGERPDGNRLNHQKEPIDQEKELSTPSEGQSNTVPASPAASKLHKWMLSLMRHPPTSGLRTASPGLTWTQADEAFQIKRRAKRSRGHGHSKGGRNHHQHPQFKRVGCVLGTCQVQNLSHRLYQLIGQNGREESSPINPRSPHSYG